MSYDSCFIDVQNALGRNISKAEMKEIRDVLEEITEKYKDNPMGESTQAKIDRDIQEFVINAKAGAMAAKLGEIQNAKARIALTSRLRSNWDDALDKGLEAFFVESNIARAGARDSIERRMTVAMDEVKSGVASDLAKKDLLKAAYSGKLDEHIARAISIKNTHNYDPNLLMKIPREAQEIADVFIKHGEALRIRANKKGAMIGKLDGRFAKRTHDPLKIRKAAGADIPVGDIRHKHAWVANVVKDLDFDASFPGVPRKKALEYLGDMYEQFANGTHVSFKSANSDAPGYRPIGSLAKKLSKERVLKFKSFEGEWAYYKTFSKDGNLAGNLLEEMEGLARNTSLMDSMGASGFQNVRKAVDDLRAQLIKEGRGGDAAKLSDQLNWIEKTYMPLLDGSVYRPDGDKALLWSKRMSAVRGLMGASQLGRAMLTQISDVIYGASQFRYSGDRNFIEFTRGLYDHLSGTLGMMGRAIGDDKRAIAEELGIFIDAINPIPDRFNAGTADAGNMSKQIQFLYKLTGLQHWQDRSRLAATMSAANRYARNASKNFDEIPEGMREYFKQFNIGQQEWDLFRNSVKRKDANGREFLTLGAIDELDNQSILKSSEVKKRISDLQEANASKKNKLTNEQIEANVVEQYKGELKTKFSNMFSDYAYSAATEPGLKARAFMLQGTKSGTWPGEIMRSLFQYKSFTVAMAQKHLGRELFGYSHEAMSVPQALMKMFDPRQDNSGLKGMASMVAWGIPLGYASMALKDIAKGREPRVPKDGEEAFDLTMAAMLQSGALGIYGDFLFGEAKNRFGQGALETLTGPVIGQVATSLDTLNSLTQGTLEAAKGNKKERDRLFKEAAKNTIDQAFTFTPYAGTLKNHMLTHAAFNYLIMYNIKEMMSPGYLKRMEKRAKKEMDQEYFLPPSKVIKRGGGFK